MKIAKVVVTLVPDALNVLLETKTVAVYVDEPERVLTQAEIVRKGTPEMGGAVDAIATYLSYLLDRAVPIHPAFQEQRVNAETEYPQPNTY